MDKLDQNTKELFLNTLSQLYQTVMSPLAGSEVPRAGSLLVAGSQTVSGSCMATLKLVTKEIKYEGLVLPNDTIPFEKFQAGSARGQVEIKTPAMTSSFSVQIELGSHGLSHAQGPGGYKDLGVPAGSTIESIVKRLCLVDVARQKAFDAMDVAFGQNQSGTQQR